MEESQIQHEVKEGRGDREGRKAPEVCTHEEVTTVGNWGHSHRDPLRGCIEHTSGYGRGVKMLLVG